MQGLLRYCNYRWRAFHNLPWHDLPIAEKLSVLAMEGRLQEAVATLHRADPSCLPVSPETYLRLIRSCIKFKAFAEGQEIHKHMVQCSVKTDIILQNNLMILYSKSGEVHLAHELFDQMTDKNLFSWTAVIGAHCNSGNPDRALELYKSMLLAGIRSDQFLYPVVLKSCARMKDFRNGQWVHAHVLKDGFQWDSIVKNSLIDMYMKCLSVEDAERVFNEMIEKDVVSWATMISGYVQASLGNKAIGFFKEMLHSNVRLQSATFVGILPFFSDMGCFELVRQLHALIIGSGCGFDKFVGSALMEAYSNCGGLGYGQLVFDRVRGRDVACWNAMIKGYARIGLFDEAIRLFKRMKLDGVDPNTTTWDCIVLRCLETGTILDALDLMKQLEYSSGRAGFISASALLRMGERMNDILQLKELHGYMLRAKLVPTSDVALILIDLFAKFGDPVAAREVFESINEKDLGLWNSIIACYADNGQAIKAIELFDMMQMAGIKPDTSSWNAVISGLVKTEDFEAALEMFAKMKWTNQTPDMRSYETILPAVGSFTCPDIGKQLHNMFLRNNCEMSTFVNTAFITMYCNCQMLSYAIKLFDTMISKDIVSWNAIISGLAKNGLLSNSRKIFGDLESEGIEPNIITWTSLISGYVQNGQVDEAFDLFRQLKHRLNPNSVTIASILPACAQSAALSRGKAIHGYVIRSGTGYNDPYVANTLMDMFMKCGSMLYAERVFERLHQREVVSWNTMILGYVILGRGQDGLSLFRRMSVEGIAPDGITLVGILSACGQAYLIDEGWELFNNMYLRYGIIPSGKHYACMVDVLGRSGCFEEVKIFIVKMPLQPTASLWSVLLLSCKAHGNVEMAEYAAEQLLELQPENPWNYEILSDVYVSTGRTDDAIRVRKMMIDRGIEKQHGFSWIEVGNHVRVFNEESTSGERNGDEGMAKMLLDLTAELLAEGDHLPEMKKIVASV